MFEKNILKIAQNFGDGKKAEFFVLTHKKHRREIYFLNRMEVLKFMESKFNSPVKRIIYSLLTKGSLQYFLKKIWLPQNMGDVIFVAEQVKCFKLKEKVVLSFLKEKEGTESFIQKKMQQKEIADKGFAPKITKIDSNIPFSEEELLEQYTGGHDKKIFEKLLTFYKTNKVRKTSTKKYISELIKKLKFAPQDYKNIILILKQIRPVDKKLILVQSHGDFAKEQILGKKESYAFTDWKLQENLIVHDLVNFFLTEEKIKKIPFEQNKEFRGLLELYPENVRKNLAVYLFLNEIGCLIKKKDYTSKKRLKRLSSYLPLLENQSPQVKELAN